MENKQTEKTFPSMASIEGHVKIYELAFCITRQCNAYCEFCCNDDGPHKTGVLDISQAREWIKEFTTYVPYCKRAGFTGGEAFLRYDEMLTVQGYLHEFGFTTSITTNGFWGNNIPKARNQIRQLQELGLKEITISMDPTHADWINQEDAATAAKVAVEAGLTVLVSSNIIKEGRSAKEYFEPDWHPFILFDENRYILPAGRAKSLKTSIPVRIPPDNQLLCPYLQMIIQPNGDVNPCCSVCLDGGKYTVGNLFHQSMEEILLSMLSDMYLKIITHQSLFELERIVQKYHPEWRLPPKEHTVCYMCNAIRSASDFWKVRDAMEHYSMEFLLNKIENVII